MPEIPQLGQSNRLEYTSPVQIASVEQAGVTGQQIQRTGAAVMELGQDIADVENRKTAAKRNLDAATASQEARQAAIDAKDEVLRDPNISPANFTKAFSEKYEKAVAPIRKRHKGADPLVEQAVGNSILDIRNDFNQDLSQLGRVESSAQMVSQVKALSSQGSALAYRDANQIDGQIIDFDKALVGLSKTGFYDAKTALKVRSEGPAEIVQGGIIGRVDENRFDDAKVLLKKYAPYLDVQKVQALDTYIGSEQLRYTNTKHQEEERQEKKTKRLLEVTQGKNFSNLAGLILNAKTEGEKERLFSQARILVGKQQLQADGDGSYDTLKKLDKDAKGEDDESSFYHFTERLTGGYDLDKLRNEVIADVSSNKMGHKAGIKALTAIETHQRREENDPMFRESMRIAKEKFTAKFGKENPWFPEMFPADSRLAKATVMERWLTVMEKNPNLSPTQAADIVLKKQFGSAPVLVPRLKVSEQQSPKEIDKGISRLSQDYKSKKITKRQYIESLEAAKRQKEYLLNKGGQ